MIFSSSLCLSIVTQDSAYCGGHQSQNIQSGETVHLRATLRVFPKLVINDQRILLLKERVYDTEV